MSSAAVTYHVIICDGCGETFGNPPLFESSAEARQAALDAGWRIIPKVGKNGRLVRVPDNIGRVGGKARDGCPKCAPSMQPEEWKSGSTNGAWWMDRIKRLEAENAALRGSTDG